MFLRGGGLCFSLDLTRSAHKEGIVVEKSRVPGSAVANVTLTSPAVGLRLHWDGESLLDVEASEVPFLSPSLLSFQAVGPPSFSAQALPYWTAENVRFVPLSFSPVIAWEQAAACTLLLLDPLLLANLSYDNIASATGELVWIGWGELPASATPAVRPALLIHSLRAAVPAAPTMIVPSLPACDPLLRHVALALRAKIEGTSTAERLYAEVLTNALAVHFLRRYAASQPHPEELTGGLSPYKLRRTTAYIKAHLTHELSLVTLAAVGETSPAHFARLFKLTTGRTPHQYVIMCRMDRAKLLLAETEVSLSDIGLQVGCADQSHFTALFHKHVSMTPKAYRDSTKTPSEAPNHGAPGEADA